MPIKPEEKDKLREHIASKWIREHPDHESEITAALDTLADDKDVNTVDKAQPAIDQAAEAICKGIRIFVSAKLNERDAAEALLDPFKKLGNGRILIDEQSGFPFFAETASLAGKQYMDKISATLDQTHWFFILLPDEARDRSWTMYETGVFRHKMYPGDRLFCIVHETIKPAGPLESFDWTPATYESLLELYKQLLCREYAVPGMKIINPQIEDKDLEPYVNALSNVSGQVLA